MVAFDRSREVHAGGPLVLGDCGVPPGIMCGFAILARCAGLVGHVHEEQQDPAMRAMWQAADQAVPYDEAPKKEPGSAPRDP